MAKKEEGTGKTRVTLDLEDAFIQRLDELERLTHLKRPDVIRHALQIYEFVATMSLEGYKFISEDRRGERERLAFFAPPVAKLEPKIKKEEREEKEEQEAALVG